MYQSYNRISREFVDDFRSNSANRQPQKQENRDKNMIAGGITPEEPMFHQPLGLYGTEMGACSTKILAVICLDGSWPIRWWKKIEISTIRSKRY